METHVEPIGKLTSDEYLPIEKEYAGLERLLHQLRDTCCNLDNQLDCHLCSSEKYSCCQRRLPSFIHDLIKLREEHFYHEELSISGKADGILKHAQFKLHQQAHDGFMRELNSMLGECHHLKDSEITAEG